MMYYAIMDDEPIAHRIIEGYCKNLSHLKKVGNCYNAFEAMMLLGQQKVDLLFLDINMPKLSGFDFLKTLVNPPKIIVTTAYKEFALEGYELNITDYLLKPFSFDRFLKAINKTFGGKVEAIATDTTANADQPRLFIKGDKKHHQINSGEILFVEAYGNYTKLYLKNDMLVSHEKISNYEGLLPANNFLRVHKSFLVALDKIKSIEGNRITIENHKIPIGQTYKENIKKLFGF